MIGIGIAIGDVTGIGPEVTLKALSAAGAGRKQCCYVLVGDAARLKALNRQLGLGLSLRGYRGTLQADQILVWDPLPRPLPRKLKTGAPEAAWAAYDWVKQGAQLCLEGKLNALVTAPVNKEAIVRSGIPFVGQTELLSELSGTERTAMM
jgi:4-hydroxy-L-threonine phosphate dehydrogenase PdxA